jgi:arylsulfatase A-like enzyme
MRLSTIRPQRDRTGHSRDTAVLPCSDHGDYAGDCGLIEKWPAGLEDCRNHVPLIVRIPGGKEGNVSRELTELYDIMPTCLDLAGTNATQRPDTITRCAAVRTARYKYIDRPNDQSELYDCQQDSMQLTNMFGDTATRDGNQNFRSVSPIGTSTRREYRRRSAIRGGSGAGPGAAARAHSDAQ